MFPDINVYPTRLMQGTEQPCFFVLFIKEEAAKILSSSKKHVLHFMIAYKPALEDTAEIIQTLQSRLLDLDVFQNGDFRFRIMNKEMLIKDGEWQLSCNVSLREWNCTADELMQKAELKEEIKQYE